MVPVVDNAEARLAVSRHACALFWAHGVPGDERRRHRLCRRAFHAHDLALLPNEGELRGAGAREIAGPIPRSGGPVATRAVARGPPCRRLVAHPLTPQDIDDEISAMRIATMTTSEPALRTAYLMVHDEMERGSSPWSPSG